jgi:hypothetical protein
MGILASSASVARQICRRDLDCIGAGRPTLTTQACVPSSRRPWRPMVHLGSLRGHDACRTSPTCVHSQHCSRCSRGGASQRRTSLGSDHRLHRGRLSGLIDHPYPRLRFGFARDAAKSFGIREGMRSGFTSVGSTVSIETSATQGTTVSLTLPISALKTVDTQSDEIGLFPTRM